MSWSFSANGYKGDVAQEIEQAMPGIAAQQGWSLPQAVNVRNAIVSTLNAFPEAHINLSASGHGSGFTINSNAFEPVPEPKLIPAADGIVVDGVIVPANG